MPVFYKLHKVVRTFKDGRQDKANNRWYAKAVINQTVSTDEISELIQNRCSLTKSDVKGCIEALIDVIREEMLDSKAVKLQGLGTFRIGLKCKGAETVGEFTVGSNIVGSHVNFYPARTIDAGTGKQTVALLKGLRVKETAKNDVEKD